MAYIVPTKDHPADLFKLLQSFRRQTELPDQIIIVDGSDNVVDNLINQFSDLKIDYIRIYPPGLTKQRNAGVKALRPEITIAGYLDDDLVLDEKATENMLKFWDSASAQLGGTSFNITNNTPMPLNWYTKLFWINKGEQGVILKSGFNVVLFPVYKDTQVQWLCGGATIWRKKVLDNYKFEEWFQGCAYIDDIDFCMRVRKKYELMVVEGAKVEHFCVPVVGKKNYQLAKANVINRYYFVKKYPELSASFFFWAVFGHIAANILLGILTFKKTKLYNALGSMAGVLSTLNGGLNTTNRDFHK
ncbi:MAG: glycosyltransferase [bacterium]